jgi:hypothetical protein
MPPTDDFREHPLYAGYYANEVGDVWSDRSARFIQGHKDAAGYERIGISYGHPTKKKIIFRHVFVFECFNRVVDSSTHQIDHIDSDITNNLVKNLQMLSIADHARKTHAGHPNKSGPARCKSIARYLVNDAGAPYDIVEYTTLREAASACHTCPKSLYKALKDPSKLIGGFYWKYADQPDLEEELWVCLRDPRFRSVEISNQGRVKSVFGVKSFGYKNSAGYRIVTISGRAYCVHSLVCLAFHGKAPSDTHTVDHIDRVRDNNSADNLRWATKKMQSDNAVSIPVVAYNADGTEFGRWVSAAEAARAVGGTATNIASCINGRSGTHKGYIWKRADGAAPKVMRTSIAKPVIAYHADMSEFRSWPSVREAAEDIGCVVGSINACLAGHFKTYKSYVWKRPASIDAKPSPAMTARKLHSAQAVAAYDMTGVEAHKFISAAEAGRSLGISAAHITKCCNGTRKSAGGFTWKKI